ncbi:MAG: helix-turn-helix domain-containing protein [Polyangiales bacterium]
MEHLYSSIVACEASAAPAGLGLSGVPAPLSAHEPSPRPMRLAVGTEPAVPKLRVARRENNDAFERAYLLRVLEATNQNVTRAAKLAGVSRQQIQRLMIKHRVKRGEPR